MDSFFHSSSSSSDEDSGDSLSPHSRDTTDQSCDNNGFSTCNDPCDQSKRPPPPPCTGAGGKVKFMCSYGGKIAPRPHDHRLAYLGGHTKLLVVHRDITFASILAKLSSFDVDDAKLVLVSFKYQLPGEDLDALVSVTNDEDLHHMMLEYDHLARASPKPPFPKLRLFLFFPLILPASPVDQARVKRLTKEDNLGKGSALDPDQDRIQLTQKMMDERQEQEAAFQRNGNENSPSANGSSNGDLYGQKMIRENTSPPSGSALLVPTTLQIPTRWQNNFHLIGSRAYDDKKTEQQRQPLYLIPPTPPVMTLPPVYHHPMQSLLLQDVYGGGHAPPQVQHIVGMYGEGGLFFPPTSGVAAADEGYAPAAYESAGRHVQYGGNSGDVIAIKCGHGCSSGYKNAIKCGHTK